VRYDASYFREPPAYARVPLKTTHCIVRSEEPADLEEDDLDHILIEDVTDIDDFLRTLRAAKYYSDFPFCHAAESFLQGSRCRLDLNVGLPLVWCCSLAYKITIGDYSFTCENSFVPWDEICRKMLANDAISIFFSCIDALGTLY